MTDDLKQMLADEAESSEAAADTPTPLVRNRVRTKEPAQVYSVRLPVEHLEDLRRLAEQRSIPPTTLMRRWVLERLDEELCRSSDLEQRRIEAMEDHPGAIIALTRDELAQAVADIVADLRGTPADQPGRHSVAALDPERPWRRSKPRP